MRIASVLRSALLAAASLLLSQSALAGRQVNGSILAEVAEASPALVGHFTCESRPFDLSKGLYCYNPFTIRAAYGTDNLQAAGADGTGQTIVILDAFGSPTIAADLAAFDNFFGIPPPPSFQQISMGAPPFDPSNNDMVGWTVEIALDVEWAHAIAPNASIVLVAAKSDFDQDLIDGFNFAVDNHLGSVISMSFGESEIGLANPDGLDIIANWQAAFAKAAKAGITALASSGDQGVDTQGFGTPSASFPASSDLVTGVGGTNLRFGTATNAAFSGGTYQSEQVWDDPADNNNIAADTFGAGGGGMSFLIKQPQFQTGNVPRSVATTLHGFRGVPDLAYNAGVAGGVLVHIGTLAPGATSFFLVGGTSAGSPQWAGIVADINSTRHKSLGNINKALYDAGRHGRLNFRDVTIGNNGFDGVPGYPATAGFDLSTGWGTPHFGPGVTTLTTNGDDDDD
jgi:subtilase family serine protease